MSKKRIHFHGSDLEKIESIYGIQKDKIVSFGANVNPLGISPVLKDAISADPGCISAYPDREYRELKRALSDYCHIDASFIFPGNGSTELISLFIHALNPEAAMILGPSYSEYERELGLCGTDYQYFPLQEEFDFRLHDTAALFKKMERSLFGKRNPLFVLCNPNNPTSTSIHKEMLEAIAIFCTEHHITIMIDETYVEFTANPEEISAVSLAERYPDLIVLRGVSKFFAAPGLRLGYAVTSNTTLGEQFLTQQHPWSVNSFASVHAAKMFRDQLYIMRTKSLIAAERDRVVQELLKIPGYKVYQPEANFVLIRILDSSIHAAELFDTAIRQGLMIRDCSDFPLLGPEYFRFCFMMPEENDRLLDVISSFHQKK